MVSGQCTRPETKRNTHINIYIYIYKYIYIHYLEFLSHHSHTYNYLVVNASLGPFDYKPVKLRTLTWHVAAVRRTCSARPLSHVAVRFPVEKVAQ